MVSKQENTKESPIRQRPTYITFRRFCTEIFRKHKDYEKLRPKSNQPGRFFATAKTHKFDSFEDITLEELKIRPIIDQTGTHTHAAAAIISKHLQPLAKNEYVINNTLLFAESLKDAQSNEEEEDVSYDVDSLFTSIPVAETIDYICDKIYNEGSIDYILPKTPDIQTPAPEIMHRQYILGQQRTHQASRRLSYGWFDLRCNSQYIYGKARKRPCSTSKSHFLPEIC